MEDKYTHQWKTTRLDMNERDFSIYMKMKTNKAFSNRPFTKGHPPPIPYLPNKQKFEETASRLLDSYSISLLTARVSASKTISNSSETISDLSLSQALAYSGEKTLYISQFNVYDSKTASLPSLNRVLDCPFTPHAVKLLAGRLDSVNLWINLSDSFSKLHFDLYDNILHVLHGFKVVYLSPPNSPCVRRAASTNEAGYRFSQNQYRFSRTSRRHARVSRRRRMWRWLRREGTRRVVLGPGEFLRIPPGHFHMVFSKAHSVGINYWMDVVGQVVGNHSVYRYLMERMKRDMIEKAGAGRSLMKMDRKKVIREIGMVESPVKGWKYKMRIAALVGRLEKIDLESGEGDDGAEGFYEENRDVIEKGKQEWERCEKECLEFVGKRSMDEFMDMY